MGPAGKGIGASEEHLPPRIPEAPARCNNDGHEHGLSCRRRVRLLFPERLTSAGHRAYAGPAPEASGVDVKGLALSPNNNAVKSKYLLFSSACHIQIWQASREYVLHVSGTPAAGELMKGGKKK